MSQVNSQNSQVVFVVGQSGAGKSRAIDAFEDIGFKSIDNLPLSKVEPILPHFFDGPSSQRLAISLDVRGAQTSAEIADLKKRLSKIVDIYWLFLSCEESTLCDRFTVTRRRHPYIDIGGGLTAAIRRESHDLLVFKTLSNTTFDTSNWTPHYLARCIEETFASKDFSRKLYVSLTSFGFKYGQMRHVDNLFDVRFLPNPYFEPSLKSKTGLSKEVSQFMLNGEVAQHFLQKLLDLFEFLIPNYYKEGKQYLRIGIGCTGGMHRSVWIAETLGQKIQEKNFSDTIVGVVHRDLRPELVQASS